MTENEVVLRKYAFFSFFGKQHLPSIKHILGAKCYKIAFLYDPISTSQQPCKTRIIICLLELKRLSFRKVK